MSNALKAVLTGIILILSGLFIMGMCFMGMCDINAVVQGLTLALFVIGVIISIIGLFFVKEVKK